MHGQRVMYNRVYTHYPSFPHHHHHHQHHHGVNVCSSYNISPVLPPISDVNICISPCYHGHPYKQAIPSYIDYPYYNYVSQPIIQTRVRDNVCYYVDDPDVIYDDEYKHPYRLSRSKIQLVDIVPKSNQRINQNRLVVSTYESKEPPERIILPRSNIVRHKSLPIYERPKPVRLLPLYHSADPRYLVANRRSRGEELVQVKTIPKKRIITVR